MQRKKIAILTMNYDVNYGGILQCVALQNSIKNLVKDVEVDVIRFSYNTKKHGFDRILRLMFSYSPKRLIGLITKKIIDKSAHETPERTNIYERCSEFILRNINYTSTIFNEKNIYELSSNYDVVVIGSDKIWGGVNKKELIYFGSWINTQKTKVISYAACSSSPSIPFFNRRKIANYLNHFSAISVRDNYTKQLFTPVSRKKIDVVLDPTLLYEFDANVVSTPLIQGEYILTYVLGEKISGGHSLILNELKKKNPTSKIVSVVLPNNSKDICKYADVVLNNATPDEWINLISNSSCVYTDSFHGVIFCLKYRKNFIAYYAEDSRSTRLIDLSNEYGLYAQIVSSVKDAQLKESYNFNIDFDYICSHIEKNKKVSLDFLNKNIK